MASRALHREDLAGLALALALHAGLVALLVLHPPAAPLVPPPERITVTLSEDVGLTSTSPEPQAEAAPPAAPEIAPVAEPVTMPAPRLQPAPRPLARPQPRVMPAAAPRVTASPLAAAAARTPPRPATASRISSDFLKGVSGAQATGTARNPPATALGPAVRSALLGAVSRKLKPRWAAPQGAEADRLVTFVSWSLNRDGSLAGTPRVTGQQGITDANRAQATRHAEQAVRAIQLAAPFELPEDYYDAWKRIVEFRFDRKLSQ